MTTQEQLLQNILAKTSSLDETSGKGGFEVLPGAVEYTDRSFYAIVVLTAATFTQFEVDGVDVLTARGLDSISIPAGAFLPAGRNSKITLVETSAGNLIGY